MDEQDIDIVTEGLRPGEKMYEELFITNDCNKTQVSKISTANEVWLPWKRLEPLLDDLRSAILRGENKEIKSQILSLAFLENSEVKQRMMSNSSASIVPIISPTKTVKTSAV